MQILYLCYSDLVFLFIGTRIYSITRNSMDVSKGACHRNSSWRLSFMVRTSMGNFCKSILGLENVEGPSLGFFLMAFSLLNQFKDAHKCLGKGFAFF